LGRHRQKSTALPAGLAADAAEAALAVAVEIGDRQRRRLAVGADRETIAEGQAAFSPGES
jgi:hypothetical protein